MSATFSNFQSSTTTTAPLLIAGTSLDSSGFANLPTIAAPDYMWCVLDPTGVAGLPEIVQITAHTALSTNVTIVRAQQGTTARQHLATTIWRHSSTKADYDELPFRKLTTTGDVLYASAANTTARLPIGTTGQQLSVVAGAPAWTGLTSYTPAITWVGNTVSAVVAQYTHVSGFLIIACQFTATNAATGQLTIPLPGSYTAVIAGGINGGVGLNGGTLFIPIAAAGSALIGPSYSAISAVYTFAGVIAVLN